MTARRLRSALYRLLFGQRRYVPAAGTWLLQAQGGDSRGGPAASGGHRLSPYPPARVSSAAPAGVVKGTPTRTALSPACLLGHLGH